MTHIKSTIKEGVGFIEEEAGELLHDEKTAAKGRDLRNEGRIGSGKAPKLSKPGSGA